MWWIDENWLKTIQKFFNLDTSDNKGNTCNTETVFDTGKSSTSGMPMVEDGLSSSQGSDTEDTSTMDTHRPSEILKRRYSIQLLYNSCID